MVKRRINNINEQIQHPEVRITGDNIESRILNIDDAIDLAESKNLDLVEIVPHAKPPVCKIVDYKKFLHDKKQKEKDNRKNQRKNKVKVKEIRLSYNTGDHDFNFKLEHAKNFLKNNDKVKVVIFFRGREIQFKDQGELLILKFIDSLSEYGKPESLPLLENKRLWTIVKPK